MVIYVECDVMNKPKVYCGQCKWYESPGQYTDSICSHPSNSKSADTFYRAETKAIWVPWGKNKKNRCKLFEAMAPVCEQREGT